MAPARLAIRPDRDILFLYGFFTPFASDGQNAPGGALQSAIAHLCRGLRADGTYESVPEGEVSGYQWRALEDWARRTGRFLSEKILPETEGGREHDLRFDAATRRWLKFTKPFQAGYTVAVVGEEVMLLPATPLQYLERWRTGNNLFGDDAQLLGLSKGRGGERLVVSQQDIAGEAPTWEEIESAFVEQLGFRRLTSQFIGRL